MDFKAHLLENYDASLVEALLSSLQAEPLHCLILNLDKIDEDEFLKDYPLVKPHPFIPHSYFYEKEVYDFGKSLLFDAGAIYIQDSAAMLVSYLLSPKPHERVLDMCAAPGGKSIFASILMKNEGLIVGNDLSYPRAKTLSSNVERMGRGNIVVTCNDLAGVVSTYEGAFDAIILDAPCSGSAMFRKNEEAEKDWTIEKVLSCASTQKELLELAYRFLRKGGRMVYSTCSFSCQENEGNIAAFLASHPDMKAVPAPINSPLFYHDETVKEGIHLFPHRYPGEGQYMVLLAKEGEERKSECAKKSKLSKKEEEMLERFGLSKRHGIILNNSLYAMSEPFDIKGFTVLRAGIKVSELDGKDIPDHALARFTPFDQTIPLAKEDALRYLAGETFPTSLKDGFYVVSYKKMSLGYIKAAKGTAKNHYPKGLRYRYKEI